VLAVPPYERGVRRLSDGLSDGVYTLAVRALWIILATACGGLAIPLAFEDATVLRCLAVLIAGFIVAIFCLQDEGSPTPDSQSLGNGPRTVLQAVACAVVFVVASMLLEVNYANWWRWRGGTPKGLAIPAALFLEQGLVSFLLPACVEMRARGYSASTRRDVLAASATSLTGGVSLVLGFWASGYSERLSYGSPEIAMEWLGERLPRLWNPELLKFVVVATLFIFAPPVAARLRGARPWRVLVVAVVGPIIYVVTLPANERSVEAYKHALPFSFALSIGPALSDRLLRRIE
jgi:hypothetical protein